MAPRFKNKIIIIFFFLLFTITQSLSFPVEPKYDTSLGAWTLLHRSIGISAMHMQLLFTDHIVIFDRTDFGPSNLSLPSTNCLISDDCTAHSVLYDVVSNSFRPLTVLTDTFCSSGSVEPSGILVQTGGYRLGERVIRTFPPCYDLTCDWYELAHESLAARRWYASNHILPDGRVIIVGGRGSHSYEFYPSQDPDNPIHFRLQFLADTWDGRNTENNLYPFLTLLPNGHLFIFANNRSIEFDYLNGKIIREFPIMPSKDKRNYPSTGSATLLPLILNGSGAAGAAEVFICGGASPESFHLAQVEKVYVAASRSCGRLKIIEDSPRWIMEEMPMPRVMPDMVLLPTGDVLIINGAGNGTAGWNNGDNPVVNPVLYKTYEPDRKSRFVVLNPTTIPRMYHSSAVLVSDGRIIVGGSNPHPNYNFTPEAKYPTELSLEGFSPPYLDMRYAELRPSILAVELESKTVIYGQMVSVTYTLGNYRRDFGVDVTMMMPPFATHSVGMNQRVVVLGGEKRVDQLSAVAYKVTVRAPLDVNVAPPGYYMLFVVHYGVPSHGVWVQLRQSKL